MHYIANTVYHASNKDFRGKLKGEPTSFQEAIYFSNSKVPHYISDKTSAFIKKNKKFKVVEVEHKKDSGYDFRPKFTFEGFTDKWHECQFDDKFMADAWAHSLNNCKYKIFSVPTAFSQGKKRDFDNARLTAVWPEATDEELSVGKEELEAALKKRLPALLAQFRADIEAMGFMWQCPTLEEQQNA